MSEHELAPQTPAQRRDRYQRLLRELERRGLDGFLVPRGDEHQGEYVPPRAQRLAWLTGFTGSAGLAIVHRRGSAIFVDGRYTLQVAEQVDTTAFAPQHLMDQPPRQWLGERLQAGDRIGFDPWLHTPNGLEPLRKVCDRADAELLAVETNPVDSVWEDQPGAAAGAGGGAAVGVCRRAGRGQARTHRPDALAEEGIAAAVLTQPDAIAWLLNVRGADVERSPLPLSFAVLHADARVEWLIDPRKLNDGIPEELGTDVTIEPPQRFAAVLEALAGQTVRVDPGSAASWIFGRLEQAGATIDRGVDPCALPKALKNPAELAGTRAAHLRDGIALSRFLHWLHLNAADGGVDELGAAERLHQFRQDSGQLRDLSFDTISGAGANGAIVHYRVTPNSNRELVPPMLYLVDSGGQYLDGTTDVTRTISHRHAHRRAARPLHAGAERAYQPGPGPVSGRHQRRSARYPGALCAVAGRAGFRSWHRPRGRQLSVACMRGRSGFPGSRPIPRCSRV